jgi:hypothetical protein
MTREDQGVSTPRYDMDKYLDRRIACLHSQKQSDVFMEIFRNTDVMVYIQIVGLNLIENAAFFQDFLVYLSDPFLSTLDLSYLLGKKLFACPFVVGFRIAVFQLALHQ